MPYFNIYRFAAFFTIIFMLIVIELVRRNKLHEKYSILWLAFSVTLVVLASVPRIIDILAGWLGIKYAPSLLFLVGFIFLIIYNISITTAISSQGSKITRLAQELALLKAKNNGKRNHTGGV